jgi:hypothetical protein
MRSFFVKILRKTPLFYVWVHQKHTMSRHRNVCFTVNNPTIDDLNQLRAVNSRVKYMVCGLEVGESGTPHIQGYVELTSPMSFEAVKKSIVPSRAHIEERKGSARQAAGYCKKGVHSSTDSNIDYSTFAFRPMTSCDEEGDWEGFEYGSLSAQGKRTDLTPATEMISHGSTLQSVAMTHPDVYVRYNRGLRDLRSTYLFPRNLDQAPTVLVLWGETGTGKTRDALTKYSPEITPYVFRPSNGNWWDGYDGQMKVILEEFRGSMPWADLLGLLDRNEYRAPVKGGFVHIQSDLFIITSPCPPEQWYKQDDRYDKFSQLKRRITKVIHYTTFST